MSGDSIRIPGIVVSGELDRSAHRVDYRATCADRSCLLRVAADTAGPDRETAFRAFRTEAVALARARHSAIPAVLEMGSTDGRPYAVIELPEGETLAERLRWGRLAEALVVKVAVRVLGGLLDVHRRGLVHGRLQASQIVFVGGEDDVRILGFGAGGAAGAPGPIDYRSDFAALGRLLYECATGRPAYAGLAAGKEGGLHELPELSAGDAPLTSADLSRLVASLVRLESGSGDLNATALLQAFERLEAGVAARPSAPSSDTTPPLGPDELPLVGRDEELEVLHDAWSDARSGVAAIAHVRGAPGSGKTRLVQAFLARAGAQSRLVLRARCVAEDARPFAALGQLLHADARAPGEAPSSGPARGTLQSALRDAGHEMAPLVRGLSPELARLFGDAAELGAPHEVQALFAENAAEFLGRLLQSSGPALVWIDDLQWMDPSSRAVLTRVADRARGTKTLFVVTSRADDEGNAEADAFFRPIRNLRLIDVDLSALSPGECRALVEAHLQAPGLPAEVIGPLVTLGDGTPMSLIELLHAIAREGLLTPFWGNWRLDRHGLERMQFPTRAREILARRVAELSPNTRRVMGAAAVLGSTFDEDLLSRVLRVADLAPALREARDARVLVRVDAKGSHFVHETIREALIAPMAPGELRAVHQRLAEELDATGATDLPQACRLAAAYAAGDWERAPARVFFTNYEAGLRTFSAYDNDRALSFLTVAERAAVAAAVEPEAPFFQALGELYLRRGALSKSREYFERALARTRTPLGRGIVHSRIAWVDYTMGETARAWTALAMAFESLAEEMPRGTPLSLARSVLSWSTVRRQLRPAATPPPLPEEERLRVEALCTLHYQSARLALETEAPSRFLAHILHGIRQAERLGPSRALVRMLLAYGFTMVTVGLRDAGLAYIDRAEAMAEAIRDPVVSAYALQMRSVVMGWAGELGAALQAGAQLLLERGHWLELSEYCLLCWNQGLMLGLRGDAQGAWEWTVRAIDKIRHELHTPEIAHFVRDSARAALLTLGREGELANHFEGIALPPPSPESRGPHRRFALGPRVRAFTEIGDFGPDFEAIVAEVRASGVDPKRAHLVLCEVYLHVAHARVHQCLRSSADDLPPRLAELAVSLRELRAIARIPILSAHLWVVEGYQALFEGAELRASLLFTRADDLAQRESCPWVLFAAARGRAHLHARAGRQDAAELQASLAGSIAEGQGYAYRLRWVREEFPAVDPSTRKAPPRRDASAARQLDALLQISRASPSDLNLGEQVKRIVDELLECFHADRGALFLSPETGGVPVPMASRLAHGQDAPPPSDDPEDLLLRAFQSGRTLVERAEAHEGEGPASGHSIVASPLVLRERVIGVVSLEAGRPLTDDDARLLETLANQAAVTLELTRVLRARAEELRARKVLEDELRQAQKMEAIGRLAGAIAHDFNNLLAIIVGTLDCAQRDHEGVLTRELADIRQACERGVALTRQLLTFSRRQSQSPRQVRLNEFLTSSIAIVRRLLPENIEVVTRFQSERDTILADPIRLEQVLLNLTANARDAMSRGGRLTIATGDARATVGEEGEERSADCVALTVIDTGQGMAPDVLRQVFEPFFTTKSEGTGLGLATVYGIVRQMGGRITVDSVPGEGTVFHMYFPCAARVSEAPEQAARISDRPVASEASMPVPSQVTRRPATILLVDDERLILTALERGLISEGYRVVAALTGEQALELSTRGAPRIDLVITDVLMPGMSGPELVEQLEASGIRPPHIFISGYTDGAIVPEHLLDDGALLLKPFTVSALTARVRQMLDGPAAQAIG